MAEEVRGLSNRGLVVGKWVRLAHEGKFSPRLGQLQRLAEFCGMPTKWLLSSSQVTALPGTPDPASLPHAAALQTLEMAKRPAGMLEELDGLAPDRAWALMRELDPGEPSVGGYYAAARRKLNTDNAKSAKAKGRKRR